MTHAYSTVPDAMRLYVCHPTYQPAIMPIMPTTHDPWFSSWEFHQFNRGPPNCTSLDSCGKGVLLGGGAARTRELAAYSALARSLKTAPFAGGPRESCP